MLHGARVAHLLQHALSCSDVERQVQNVFRNTIQCAAVAVATIIIEHKQKNVIENGWQVFWRDGTGI
jgi:hypothetical protein